MSSKCLLIPVAMVGIEFPLLASHLLLVGYLLGRFAPVDDILLIVILIIGRGEGRIQQEAEKRILDGWPRF